MLLEWHSVAVRKDKEGWIMKDRSWKMWALEMENKALKYQIVSASEASTLEALVNIELESGWRISGSMCVSVKSVDIPPNNISPRDGRDLMWKCKDVASFHQALVIG